ncbi:MAG: cytochrome c3 family protein [Planctomycetota bacterium]
MLLLAAGLGACAPEPDDSDYPAEPSAASVAADPTSESFEVPPPPFSPGAFPCTECHDADFPVKTKRRKLTMAHEEIVLNHDQEHRWCLDCHSATNRDVLHLASGETVPFAESYKLCGQCHGDKYRDWRAGVHGRRTGFWDGPKKYLCA